MELNSKELIKIIKEEVEFALNGEDINVGKLNPIYYNEFRAMCAVLAKFGPNVNLKSYDVENERKNMLFYYKQRSAALRAGDRAKLDKLKVKFADSEEYRKKGLEMFNDFKENCEYYIRYELGSKNSRFQQRTKECAIAFFQQERSSLLNQFDIDHLPLYLLRDYFRDKDKEKFNVSKGMDVDIENKPSQGQEQFSGNESVSDVDSFLNDFMLKVNEVLKKYTQEGMGGENAEMMSTDLKNVAIEFGSKYNIDSKYLLYYMKAALGTSSVSIDSIKNKIKSLIDDDKSINNLKDFAASNNGRIA